MKVENARVFWIQFALAIISIVLGATLVGSAFSPRQTVGLIVWVFGIQVLVYLGNKAR